MLAHPALVYAGGIALLTVLLVWLGLAVAHASGAAPGVLLVIGVLALLPASEVAQQIVNYLIGRLLPPRVLPKLVFEDGVPDAWRTLVVVPMLLLSREEVQEDLERLEIRFLANQGPNFHFALLADFPDAPQPVMPEDASLLDAARRGIEALNARYPAPRCGGCGTQGLGGGHFSLLYRQRQWSVTEQVWMGWERKRGKLEELNRLLISRQIEADPEVAAELEGADLTPSTLQHVGDPRALDGVRFVITLDADTQLPYGAARRLVETLAHPLNRPRLAPDGRTVAQGYTIIQPRVSTTLPSATATRFSRFFTDPVGTDPYTQAVSDVYQDLAGEGSYIGKGIYDVRTFHRVLGGRFPDALLLSHDLVEGAHVRVGLATDIELFDQFPSSYLAYSGRQHRWIRGDWQVADWCLSRVPAGPAAARTAATGPGRPARRVSNPLSPFNRWKIFDNLRRSLVPASAVAFLLAGWLLDPRVAWLWSLLFAGVFLLPPLLGLLTWIVAQPEAVLAPQRTWRGWKEQSTGWVRTVLTVALLPHQAFINLDAIGASSSGAGSPGGACCSGRRRGWPTSRPASGSSASPGAWGPSPSSPSSPAPRWPCGHRKRSRRRPLSWPSGCWPRPWWSGCGRVGGGRCRPPSPGPTGPCCTVWRARPGATSTTWWAPRPTGCPRTTTRRRCGWRWPPAPPPRTSGCGSSPPSPPGTSAT